jgi:hypothetical protein
MIVADTPEAMRRNIAAFRDGWRDHPKLMKRLELVRKGSYWLFDEGRDAFANAKFAGYNGMSAEKYARARDGHFEGTFHGNVNRRIASVLQQDWRKDENLAARLERFASRMAGSDATKGIGTSKWRFVVLPEDRTSVQRARPRSIARASTPQSGDPELDADLVGFEGGRKLVKHLSIERDRALVAKLKRSWSSEDPDLRCVVCGFSFRRFYGELGMGYIEAHHRHPLSSRGGSVNSTESDFERVCANCHRMLHRNGLNAVDSQRLRRIIQVTGRPRD